MMVTRFASPLLFSIAAIAASLYHLILTGHSTTAAWGGIAAASLLYARSRRGSPVGLGTTIAGISIGMSIAYVLCINFGMIVQQTVLAVGIAVGSVCLLGDRAFERPRAIPEGTLLRFLRGSAIALLGVAFGTILRGVPTRLLPIVGRDYHLLTFAVVPLLILSSLAAGTGCFLARRHPTHRRALIVFAGLVAYGIPLMELPSMTGLIELTQKVHAPSVTPIDYRFGATLLSLAIAGGSVAAIGFLGGLMSASRRSATNLFLLAVTAWLALGQAIPTPGVRPILPVCVALAAVCSLVRRPAPVSLVLVLSFMPTLLIPTVWRRNTGEILTTDSIHTLRDDANQDRWDSPHDRLNLDPVRSAVTGPEPTIPLPKNGRITLPLGWPFRGDEHANFSFLAPPIAIVAPKLWAEPLLGLRDRIALVRREIDRVPPVAIVDLGEIDLGDVAAIAQLIWPEGPAPWIGTSLPWLVIADARIEPPQQKEGTEVRVFPILSSAATQRLIDALRPLPHLPLLGPGRSRLSGRVLRRRGERLDHLIDRADLLPVESDGRSLEARARLRLAAAIDRDDVGAEERLLSLLERIDPRYEEGRALRRLERQRLLDYLPTLTNKYDADLHHRRGVLLATAGELREGLDELTLAVTLRPKLHEAYADLSEAYLAAELVGVRKEIPGGALDGLATIPLVVSTLRRQVSRELDVEVAQRIELAIAEADRQWASRPDTPPDERRRRLEDALERFESVTSQDGYSFDAWLGLARTRHDLEHDTAIDAARRATEIAPLRPSAWESVAAWSDDPSEAAEATKYLAAIRP